MNNSNKKIPYDATPIVREGGSVSRQMPARNKISSNIFIVAIFVFNIVISSLFIYYLFNNRDGNIINVNNNITAQSSISAVATSKAKLSSVCIGAGGTDTKGVSFSSENIPSYNELLTRTSSRGAGVIIDIDKTAGEAYILTCEHVVSGYSGEVFVLLYDSYQPMIASVIGKSTSYDLAVLKVSNSQIAESACQKATIADSSFITEGEDAIAVGNPQANGFATTVGTISRTSCLIGKSGLTIRAIQVDTAINKGNSGGGLFDKNGNLIGIVESKNESTGIDNVAFAIHSNTALSIAQNLMEGRQLQYADAGYSLETRGAYIEQIDGVFYKFDKVFVSNVLPNSDAEKAGLQKDDQIVSFTYNGKVVQMINKYSYEEIKFDLRVGDTVTYSVLRGGSVDPQSITVEITSLVSAN